MKLLWPSFVAYGVLAGCGTPFPEPYSVSDERMVYDLGHHFFEVFPRRDGATGQGGVGLLSPRFGLPAIVRRGDPISVEVLERGERVEIRAALVRSDLATTRISRCLALPRVVVPDCFPLDLEETRRIEANGGLAVRQFLATPTDVPAARAYDLVVVSDANGVQRVRRAVFLTEADPKAPRPIRVVQLSDLHIGKGSEIVENLDSVVHEVNELGPDLVIVTGDMVENGSTPGLERSAADALLRIDAPVLAIPGNHDYGHFPKILRPDEPGEGWSQFARAFHPFRWTDLTFGGWEFVGFDSGPSVFSPRVLTRGIRPETVDRIRETVDDARTDGRLGVILFSHAPTRAVLGSDPADAQDDGIGRMAYGGKELEAILLDAETRGQRVLELSGHTHWSDVFEPRDGDFTRWPPDRLACPRSLSGSVAMINAPSVTEVSYLAVEHGLHSGFVELLLDRESTRVAFHLRDRAGKPAPCN